MFRNIMILIPFALAIIKAVYDLLNGIDTLGIITFYISLYIEMGLYLMNYQKQLSTQLQELTSGKFALDDGVEDFIFADVKDMKQHLDVLRETEEKCEKIIKLGKRLA